MGFIIILILLLLLAAGCFVGGRVLKRAPRRDGPSGGVLYIIGAAVGLIAAIFLLGNSITTVKVRNVGIITEFGHPSGHIGNGLHFVPPWASVTEWDEAVQTTSYLNTPHQQNCLTVRIGGQQTACASVSIQWRVSPAAVDDLFKNYGTFGYMTVALVNRELERAVNQAMAGYSPISELQRGAQPGSQLNQISANVSRIMRAEIGRRIEILQVIMPYVGYDKATTARLAALQQQIVDTAIAQQSEKTARAQARANKALAASVSHDPNVIAARCFEVATQMVKQGMNPAGLSCWPGSGSGSTVVVPRG